MNEKKIWGGRFRDNIDAMMDQFNRSIDFDQRLYAQDIDGSIAHCRMLAKQRIITEEESVRIIEALGEIKRAMAHGDIPFDHHEDIHTLVEKCLVERIGPLGEKLHTGRSRNDQVALDTRLYVKEAITRLIRLIGEMRRSLVDLAEANQDVMMPGYTHLQRAQPVLLSHHLLAYYEMFKRDGERFEDSMKRVDVSPLGSAALAGSTFPLDRDMVARELGFQNITPNSMDAVSDRDFILEYLFNTSVMMMHLSRLSEELILWSSHEFDFVDLPEAFCTGSSIMPQKKNPDAPELIRGKTGRVYGNLMALLTAMKGLPLTYNKDLQEDKEALFDSMDTTEHCLLVMTNLLKTVRFKGENMKNAVLKGHLTATDLADYLVRKGITFRKAHEIVGRIVLTAIEENKELHEFSLKELKAFNRQITKDVFEWLDPESPVKKREIPGGTGPAAVKDSLKKARKELRS
jgi:argininosuccinate lyase